MKDFFQKISSGDHLKIQEAHIAALSQADIMDLRNVEVRAVKPTKRCVIRTPLALQIEKEPVLDSDDDDDDEADDAAVVDEDDDDEALDIFDLTEAIPPAPEPIVPVNAPHTRPRCQVQLWDHTAVLRWYSQSSFTLSCAHSLTHEAMIKIHPFREPHLQHPTLHTVARNILLRISLIQ